LAAKPIAQRERNNQMHLYYTVQKKRKWFFFHSNTVIVTLTFPSANSFTYTLPRLCDEQLDVILETFSHFETARKVVRHEET
jgi:hypothetical protein